MKPLEGKIAIAAGSSRGAGRGIAISLGAAGATVYVAARTSKNHPAKFPGTIEDTADEVTARGGKGIPVQADLGDESQVAALFDRVQKDHGRLDILTSAVWYDNILEEWSKKFWNSSPALWQSTMQTITAHWLLGVHAARIMSKQKHGLIAFVTDNIPDDPNAYHGQMMWDVGHHAINRLILGMSHELASSKVTAVGVNPGFMRTERVILHMREDPKAREQFRFDLSESVEYIGRAIAALAADPDVHSKTGQLLWGADLAKEYGFTDTDGRLVPRFDPKAPRREIPADWLQLP